MTSTLTDIQESCPEDVSLPKGWVWTRLGEVAEINPKLNENYPNDTEVTFIPMKAVEELTGRADISARRKLSQVKKGYVPFKNGDILFAKITPCMENGKIAIVDNLSNGIGFGSTEFHVIRLHESLAKKFFFFFLIREELRKDAQSHMTGSVGQKRVPKDYIEQLMIPLAPLSEQRRIVAKVEELFTQLTAGKKTLDDTITQLKSYGRAALKHAFDGKLTESWRDTHEVEPASSLLKQFNTTVASKRESNEEPSMGDLPELPKGWIWTRISRIGEVSGGITKNQERKKYPKKLPYLGVANVYANELRLDNLRTIGVKETELDRVLLRKGDLLVVEGNGSLDQIGRVALWDGSISPVIHQNHIIKVRFRRLEIGRYVLHWLLSAEGRKQITRVASSTSGLYTLSISKVSALPVPLAPFAEQQKIIEELERIGSIASKVGQTLFKTVVYADKMHSSILKRAVSGNFVPQDPSDEAASVLLERIRTHKKPKRS